jgi:hypothetical protein
MHGIANIKKCVRACVCVKGLLAHSPAISKYAGFRHHHAASEISITNSTTVNRFFPTLSIKVTPQEVTRLLYNHVTAAPPHLASPNYVLQNSSKNTQPQKSDKKVFPLQATTTQNGSRISLMLNLGTT